MNLTGNTILITGGGSGIGRGLAEALYARGNQIVIAGRRKDVLEATALGCPGMKSLVLDIEDPASIAAAAATITHHFPGLNVLINNAGVMRSEDLLDQQPDLADSNAIIATNLVGPIHLTAALLPHLLAQPEATILNVSSGLAFVPLAYTPTYCATKAAMHSYTQSLRYQLKATTTKVIEIIPPYVATDLMDGATDPRAMPLDAFIAETMTLLGTTAEEICVQNVMRLRNAPTTGDEGAAFVRSFNDMMARNPH